MVGRLRGGTGVEYSFSIAVMLLLLMVAIGWLVEILATAGL